MKHKSKRRNEEEECCSCDSHSTNCNCGDGKCGGAVYGLGFIGAAVYYISIATSFWAGVLGFLKALVWPAFLINNLLKFVGA